MSAVRRCKNYTEFEKLRILEIVEGYKDVVNSKGSEGFTAQIKENAWSNIAHEFNSTANTLDHKSAYQLKTLYKNLKRRVDPIVFQLISKKRRRPSEGNEVGFEGSDMEFQVEEEVDDSYEDLKRYVMTKYCKEQKKLQLKREIRVARQRQGEANPELAPQLEERVFSIMEAIITENKPENKQQHSNVSKNSQPQCSILNGCDSQPLQDRLQSSPPIKQQLPTIQPKPTTGPSSISKQPTTQQGNASAQQTQTAEPEKDPDEVCLRWNSHHSNMKTTFPSLLEKEQYVDVTLSSEGQTIRCHRLILSSCSAYFDEVLSGITPLQHPVIFLKGIPFWILKSLIDFMYVGEVHIEQAKLQEILEVAEILKIKGLTGKTPSQNSDHKKEDVRPQPHLSLEPPPLAQVSKPQRAVPPLRLAVTKEQAASLQTVDPLSLLKPSFYEENVTTQPGPKKSPQPVRHKIHQSLAEFSAKQKDWLSKKIAPKKKLKRKSTDHEPSPPPVILRKGTKSRPIVKAPKYYHMEYEEKEADREVKTEDTTEDIDPTEEDQRPPLDPQPLDPQPLDPQPPMPVPPLEMVFDIGTVKSEPIDMDIEENDVNFDSFQVAASTDPGPEDDTPENVTVNNVGNGPDERIDEGGEDEPTKETSEELNVTEVDDDQPPGVAPDETGDKTDV